MADSNIFNLLIIQLPVKEIKQDQVKQNQVHPIKNIFYRNGQYPQSQVLAVVVPNHRLVQTGAGKHAVNDKKGDQQHQVSNEKFG